ncbi:hypothetical protein BO83DRAFT_210406 [Aspergillus eucalypticola CBS 122712]|uniref:Uncharacterized protein n=1 Tax=Aspergillus eucalypticola (strain CBS 122712 / IBT 29274) TaxID=1448314 RepID=A0A317UMP7_ASPEC|nr:uncharacterized protein BO83DRAFT_210406 [Aspergillus eucalypticola CBS 122712]PWY61802.1 hypothetical protein BO83DRAFT_210406 [Aspergillus eucalypticola CBS 122712]
MEWSVLVLMISTFGIKEFGIFCIVFLCQVYVCMGLMMLVRAISYILMARSTGRSANEGLVPSYMPNILLYKGAHTGLPH